MIVIAACPTGLHVIDDRGAIKLPTTLRQLCGLEYGVPVVLAAVVPEQVVATWASRTFKQHIARDPGWVTSPGLWCECPPATSTQTRCLDRLQGCS